MFIIAVEEIATITIFERMCRVNLLLHSTPRTICKFRHMLIMLSEKRRNVLFCQIQQKRMCKIMEVFFIIIKSIVIRHQLSYVRHQPLYFFIITARNAPCEIRITLRNKIAVKAIHVSPKLPPFVNLINSSQSQFVKFFFLVRILIFRIAARIICSLMTLISTTPASPFRQPRH